jgi:transcriptional regulator
MTLYTPKFFAEQREPEIDRLLLEYPFAVLISTTVDQTLISHVPIRSLRDDEGKLHLFFHLARANPQTAHLLDGAKAVAVFQGPHGYISPRWYQSRDAVPTWNYAAVHISGPVHAHDDSEALYDLTQLAAQFESGDDPWTMADLSLDKRDNLMRALQPFHMLDVTVIAKSKLSQNRPKGDIDGVTQGLKSTGNSGDHALAEWMART